MGDWTHDALREDLASHLALPNRLVWQDIQLGPSGSARPDVFTMEKSFARPKPLVYECKVSLSDFRADATAGKWMAYLDFAQGCYFAAPAGLLAKADVPPQAGLLLRGDTGWRAVKKPVLGAVVPGFDAMMKLLLDGLTRELRMYRPVLWNQYRMEQAIRKKFGADVATAVRDLGKLRSELVRMEEERRMLVREQDQLRKHAIEEGRRAIAHERYMLDGAIRTAAEAVGMPGETNVYQISMAFRAMIQPTVGRMELRRTLERIVNVAQRALEEDSQC